MNTSYWMSSVDDDLTPRAALTGDLTVDVAIVGAGYTGLWTAYYLARADPGLRIAVLEARYAGFGASGRNGGWCSALFPQSVAALARRHGRDRAVALYRAMPDTVDEVGRVARAEGIDCHYAKGGTITLARNRAQLRRAEAEVAQAREFGFGPQDLDLLGPAEAKVHCGATSVVGATYTPHCAAIHPARLVRGLARAVERRGVTIYEGTPVTAISGGTGAATVHTGQYSVRAEVVVRATEGYTPALPGYRRTVAPVYSLMIATEPLPASFWARAGLSRRQTFSDHRNVIIYGQRTADDRLAFGGRGAPYHFGSRVRPGYDSVPRVHAELAHVLRGLFPDLGPVRITHAWGGPLGITRDWAPSVGLDRSTGLAWAGGYVGDGVATTNLAGRTLADLIRGETTDLTGLPWVDHHSPRWTLEPGRWLAMNAGIRVMEAADRAEARTGRPSWRAAAFSRLLGH
jgi:glycine/D-amino acid oxidase-like deaminating enzyme